MKEKTKKNRFKNKVSRGNGFNIHSLRNLERDYRDNKKSKFKK